MTVPSSYTEATLKAYMHKTLGKVAQLLEFSVDFGSYDEAVNQALLDYGTDDITTISGADNIIKIRALAKVQAWQLAFDNAAALMGFTADGGTYNRNQIHAMIEKNLEAANTAALRYSTHYQITRRKADAIHDPYQIRTTDEREL